MVGGFPVRILVFAALGLYAVHSEVCHVQPQCTCTRRNNSDIVCDKMSTPYIPFLGMSNFQFYNLQIRGNSDVKYIHEGTFSGLNISILDIQFTGISELNCSDFSGIGQKVSRINLPNNLLKSVPGCALARFRSITKLDLRNNSISSLIAGDFEHFPSLQTLDLDANRISRIELTAFRALNELITLDLSHNNISVLHASVFDGLTELNTLDFDFNKLASLDDNIFQNLRNLRNLYLRNNRLTSLSKRTFRNLKRLGYISVMRNKITRLLPGTFEALTNLYGLSFHDNKITEIGPRVFTGLYNVDYIYLSLNKLTQINSDAFADCPRLRYLNLTGNDIQKMQPDSLRNLSSLRIVDISGNQLLDIGPGVFVNVPNLNILDLANNQISFLSDSLFNAINGSLEELNLERNSLSSDSWKWMGKSLGLLGGLRVLDLSHNPLGYIPTSALPTLDTMREVRLRNCSLDEVPDNAWSSSLDISKNNIHGPLLLRNSHTSDFKMNVSNNKITALNIKTPFRRSTSNFVCDNNQIRNSLVIEIERPTVLSDRLAITISARNNFIDETIQITFHTAKRKFALLDLNVDLSGNKYVNVTKLPLDIKNVDGEVLIPGDKSVPIMFRYYQITLNLSNNAISFISPESYLGIAKTLDLRNNLLEIFGELLPKSDSSEYELRNLYLSGNRLHRATTEAFDRYKLLYHLDLRNNDIASLDSFNIRSRFQKLYLTGNPLTCGCEIAWLRNATVPDSMDLARCHSPRRSARYLAVCFSLSACSDTVSTSVSDNTRWLCEEDSNIKLSNLTMTVENGVLNITWSKTGPGMMTGYSVAYHPVNNVDMESSTLVHPKTEKLLLSDLLKGITYKICVSAVLHAKIKSPAVCSEILVHSDTFAEAGVVIGLGSALGLCALLAGAVAVCLCVRQRRSDQHQASDLPFDNAPANPRSTPTRASAQGELDDEINSVYIQRSEHESHTEDSNVYEKIGAPPAYENTSFRA